MPNKNKQTNITLQLVKYNEEFYPETQAKMCHLPIASSNMSDTATAARYKAIEVFLLCDWIMTWRMNVGIKEK